MTLLRRSNPFMTGLFAATLCVTAVSANHSWGGYHWARTSNPVALKLGDNVNSAWDTYLTGAISDWNQSAWGRKIRSTNGGRTELYELDFGRGRKVLRT